MEISGGRDDEFRLQQRSVVCGWVEGEHIGMRNGVDGGPMEGRGRDSEHKINMLANFSFT